MPGKPRRSENDKVIHIRIDEKTHQKLKMHAASSKSTIQQLVENLIRNKYQNMLVKKVKP
jgi:predicted HicB family RNase H-like nuclease